MSGSSLMVRRDRKLRALVLDVDSPGGSVPVAPPRPLYIRSAMMQIREAVRYARSEQVILGILMLGVIPSVLVIPFVQGLMSVYAAGVFEVGPTGLGLLQAAIGVGSVISTVVLASIGEVEAKGRLVFVSCVILGVGLVLFSRNSSYLPTLRFRVLWRSRLVPVAVDGVGYAR